jgi:hypothetical protein
MKLPIGYKLKVEQCYFDGILRPKAFWSLILYRVDNPEAPFFVRYIHQSPFLLRLRIWLARRQLVKMHRKFFS